MAAAFHSGERAVQERAGVSEMAGRVGGSIRSTIPAAAREFLLQQRMAVLATVDAGGRVWVSLLTGAPGFIAAPDDRTVRIQAAARQGDPLGENLEARPELGLLAIEFHSRRRAKLKGEASIKPDGFIELHTQRVYSLCPKYIQKREPYAKMDEISDEPFRVERSLCLSEDQRLWIARADTFFIGSFHPESGADASHRGGSPGFVSVESDNSLVFPDYSGNNMFNTLGNIAVNPHAGLLFLDFETGRTLQLTGKASVIWDAKRLSEFAGAQRLVAFEIEAAIEIASAVTLRWRFVEYSPFNPD